MIAAIREPEGPRTLGMYRAAQSLRRMIAIQCVSVRPAPGLRGGETMDRPHGKSSLLLLLAILCLAGVVAARIPDSDADPDSSSSDAELDPGIIPTSAVSSSDNCSRISLIQEQFEGTIPGWNVQRIQGPEQGPPLGYKGKFRLAVANVSDPFAIITTAIDSEIGNATSGASRLPRGAAGFGERFGVSMAGEASSEFFSTFLVSSIFHQDPHYHREPDAALGKRFVHALSYVVITRSDSGTPMFNFAEFLGTAASSIAEGGLHPEWERDPGATSGRIFVSIGSDAAWNLMTEFLPDVARHINPRLILLRRLADKAAAQN